MWRRSAHTAPTRPHKHLTDRCQPSPRCYRGVASCPHACTAQTSSPCHCTSQHAPRHALTRRQHAANTPKKRQPHFANKPSTQSEVRKGYTAFFSATMLINNVCQRCPKVYIIIIAGGPPHTRTDRHHTPAASPFQRVHGGGRRLDTVQCVNACSGDAVAWTPAAEACSKRTQFTRHEVGAIWSSASFYFVLLPVARLCSIVRGQVGSHLSFAHSVCLLWCDGHHSVVIWRSRQEFGG